MFKKHSGPGKNRPKNCITYRPFYSHPTANLLPPRKNQVFFQRTSNFGRKLFNFRRIISKFVKVVKFYQNQPFGYNCISCFKRCCYCYNFFNFNHCKVISSLCHDWASWRCRSFMFDTFSNEKPSYVTKPHTNSYFRPKRRSVIGANLGLFAPYSHCLLFVPLPLQNKCCHKFYQANEII